MKSVDPNIVFDQLPQPVIAAITASLINSKDATDLLIFYGRWVHHMSLDELADRLQITKQGVSVRLQIIHASIRRTYERLMNILPEDEYVVCTHSPEEGFKLIDE